MTRLRRMLYENRGAILIVGPLNLIASIWVAASLTAPLIERVLAGLALWIILDGFLLLLITIFDITD